MLAAFVVTFLAAVVAGRDFTLYEHSNYGGASHFENRWDDDACCKYRLGLGSMNRLVMNRREYERRRG